MSGYLLGLATLPGLALLAWLLLNALVEVLAFLKNRGITIEFKGDRKPGSVGDFTLRRDIWFEKQRGPIFTGHWYREWQGNTPRVSRWVGVGSSTGRSVMFFHVRDIHTHERTTS